MLTSKQRAQLKGMAANEDTIIQIGKAGITENVVDQVSSALKARELIKCRVLDNTLLSSREACEELAKRCLAEPVQAIGSRFVLYKENREIDKTKRIRLVK